MILFWLLLVSIILYSSFGVFFLTGLFRLRNKKTVSSQNNPKVSVIIAARNEGTNLPYLINDLILQDYPVEKVEIVIADDRSTDNTWDILSSASTENSNLKAVSIKKRSSIMTPKKNALTAAINASSGDIIVTTDADCRVPKTWISSMVRALSTNRAGIAVGYSSISPLKSFSMNVEYQKLDFLALMAANAGSISWGYAWSGSGQNLAYYRHHFDAVDGFMPVADRLSGDDVYLVQSIGNEFGAVFNSNSDGFVKTLPVNTILQFIRQRIRWASNSKHLPSTDLLFFSFLVAAFLCNSLLFINVLFAGLTNYFLGFLAIKVLVDGSVAYNGSRQFDTSVNPFIFLLWSILQPLYIPFIGITGLISRFTWKN